MSFIELKDISKVYKRKNAAPIQALYSVTQLIDKGKSYALVGASGSGKSTLIGILGGVLSPTQGSYRYNGMRIDTQSENEMCRFRNQSVGIVMQDFALLENSTAMENCMIPAILRGTKKGVGEKRAKELLERFEVSRYCNTQVCFLSGGERQRVAIARGLMNQPGLLLADEPTGALDSAATLLVTQALLQVTSMGATLIIATHNMDLAARCEERLAIADGCIQETTTDKERRENV